MTAASLTIVFVVALSLATVVRVYLARRHVAHVLAHRDAVPAAFADRIGLDAHRKAADYTALRTRFGMLETVV
ncbi:MAG TPA: hypothetical protein VFJ20_01280, partial [Gemmatimonadaceae bacterium]|nr:hypothetical protein [Gemmatimonadaceae bacterium]